MKNLLVLWVMALTLVFLFSGSTVAVGDPFLDGGTSQSTSTPTEGSEDDDHPWGGDQPPEINTSPSPDISSSTTATVSRPSRLIMTTGIVSFDQLINLFVAFVEAEVFEPERVSPTVSTPLSDSVSSVYVDGVEPNRPFSKRKGVSR